MAAENSTLVILSPAFPGRESETYWVPSQQLLVKTLKENNPGLNIIVLAYFYPNQKKTYEWHGIKVISFDGLKLNRILLFLRMWKILKKIKKETHLIGLLSFWCREGAFVGKWFGKRYGLKHFCWLCGQDARKTNNYVKWISPAPNNLIAISDFISEEFFNSHKVRPAHLIPNAIVTELFPPDLSRPRDIDLLAVGSFVPLKQFDVFISVITELKNQLPGIKALICGSGEDKVKLETQIRDLDLVRNVILTESLFHIDVFKLMQRSKILLHPSSYEGFSTVCLEALYAGAHVISFTRAMNYDIKNWHIVQTKEEMARKSLELLQRVQLNHERVLIYNMDDSAKQFIRLFDSK